MENKKWFIPGSVPSSKNGKRWTGKYLISSKAVMNYRKIAKIYYAKYAKDFKAELAKHTLPAKISFTFVRGSRHKFDYINPAQTVQDDMVKGGWIEDDNEPQRLSIPLPHSVSYRRRPATCWSAWMVRSAQALLPKTLPWRLLVRLVLLVARVM